MGGELHRADQAHQQGRGAEEAGLEEEGAADRQPDPPCLAIDGPVGPPEPGENEKAAEGRTRRQ